jgi:hypothetical protein
MREIIIQAYLDYLNNYLTVEKFAEHNGLTVDQATTFIALAKDVWQSKHPEE